MLKVTIVSPLEKYAATDLSGIFLETVTGHRGILRDHMPLVAQLKDGSRVRLVHREQTELHIRVSEKAFVKFSKNEAIILTQSFTKEREDFCPM